MGKSCDDLQSIKKRIEETRLKLNVMAVNVPNGALNLETIKLSQKLDKLLMEYILKSRK
jgi:hypothetical protein